MTSRFFTQLTSLALLTGITGSMQACRSGEESSVSVFFGQHDIEIVEQSKIVEHPALKNVGQLFLAMLDENGDSKMLTKFCTGIQIGPHYVLTNHHCLQRKSATEYADYYFTKDYVAADGEGSKVTHQSLAGDLYMTFAGALGFDDKQSVKPNIEVVASSEKSDWALLKITDHCFDHNYVKAEDVRLATVDDKIELASFPNQLPLTRSYNCTWLDIGSTELKHDCDSAGGSSGGLLYDSISDAPIALHKQGAYNNSAQFFDANGRSETIRELAERECREKYKLDVTSPKYEECVNMRASKFINNRAVPLKLVFEEIAALGVDLKK